ncbi:MAG TPA: flavodoxin domain-containing protein [Candidatus Bathyarchaeia archaeon]|jgi:menaquinone-dependent protoporphyrinogen IX oxidase
MTKALIVYGTRYGAAASTSEEIAKILRQEGVEVRVVNAKEEKVRDIADYDLVVVGSGILINKWTSEPEDFLKKFQKELARKKVVLFVCCGSAAQPTTEPPEVAAKAKTKYLDEKAAQYHLQPAALGFFGGVYNYNKVPWWGKKAMEMDRPRVEAAYKQTEPGIYDTRDWNAIRSWAKELAQRFHS